MKWIVFIVKHHLKPKNFDVLTLGRSSLDLFSENLGAPFTQIESFTASIGGSPINIAVGTRRLGCKVAILTAVGDDKAGSFLRSYLIREGISTEFIPTKLMARSSLALLGIEPPDCFPLVFYRENPADVQLSIDDVQAAPIAQSRCLLLSGTSLSKSPGREAMFHAAELAKSSSVTVFLDLDIRPDQWHDSRAFGVNLRAILPLVDVAIGTEEEVYATLIDNDNPADSTVIKSLNQEQRSELKPRITNWLSQAQRPKVLVLKRSAKGVSVFTQARDPLDVPGFKVRVLNTVGAGDAFASGLIYGWLQGWDWFKSARLGNACGAIVVTRHGCASAMPSLAEVMEFMSAQGGW